MLFWTEYSNMTFTCATPDVEQTLMQQAIQDALIIGHVRVVPLLLDIAEAVDTLRPQ